MFVFTAPQSSHKKQSSRRLVRVSKPSTTTALLLHITLRVYTDLNQYNYYHETTTWNLWEV